MNFKKLLPLVPVLFGLLFCILFHKQGVGINLVLFELPLLLFIYPKIKQLLFAGKLVAAIVVVSLLLVVVRHTGVVIFFHVVSFLLLLGMLAAPKINAVGLAAIASFLNFFQGTYQYVMSLLNLANTNKASKAVLKFMKLGVLPLLVIWVFALMYQTASPWFDELAGNFLGLIEDGFVLFFEQLNPAKIGLVLLGTLIAGLAIYATSNTFFNEGIAKLTSTRTRERNKFYSGKSTALFTEYKIGVLLFVGLNGLLLLVNALDIYWVWFHFSWTGEFLKQFVHEGTYLLIFSILISAGLVLYFFKGNQHFLQKVWLKRLAQLWLIQNILLAISVAVRNWWYVQYFALAFKRIGVFYFLAFIIVALIAVVIMVRKQKSLYFLRKYNSLAALLIFFCMVIPNWNIVIAKYNFSHANSAFVELNFMSKLDKTALPYLKKSEAALKEFSTTQQELFRFKTRDMYLTEYDYSVQIDNRISEVLPKLANQHWLSWNFADRKLLKQLNEIVIN
ncbi:MAG: hypothetical protein ACJAUV_000957 [Flavobacteriales bacterium]|jgi:hypothetical protein